MNKKSLKKNIMIGKVIDNKKEKTLIILMIYYIKHSIYKKIITKKKKYFVHNPLNKKYPINTFVKFKKSRPISKKKHWTLDESSF